MKPIYVYTLLFFTALLGLKLKAQPICNANGNVVIFSNYEGGIFTIDVDQNIPNLRIGICSYNAVDVNIVGAFAANVTEVIFAGYGAQGVNDCGTTIPATTIAGVNQNIVKIYASDEGNTAIASQLGDPEPLINLPLVNCMTAGSGCFQSTTQTGGGNSSPQIVDFFLNEFGMGSVLFSHFTQYNCFTGTYVVSAGGNCCLTNNAGTPNPIYQGGVTYDFIPDAANLCNGPVSFDLTNTYPVLVQPPTYSGYVWSNGVTGPTITITQPGTYSFTVTDYCQTLTDTIVVTGCCNVEASLSPITYLNCGQQLQATVSAANGSGNYSYLWSNGAVGNSVTITNPVNGNYYAIVNDLTANCSDTAFFNVVLPTNFSIEVFGDTIACNSADRMFEVETTGGTGSFVYSWSNGSASNPAVFNAPAPVQLTVTVRDTVSNCVQQKTLQLFSIPSPLASFFTPDTVCPNTPIFVVNSSEDANTYRWFRDGVERTNDVVPNFFANDTGYTEIRLIAEGPLCSDTIVKQVPIYPYQAIDAAVVLQEDRYTILELAFPDAADSCTVDWGDGTIIPGCVVGQLKHAYQNYGAYTITLRYKNSSGCFIVKSLSILVNPDVVLYFPDVFTPNGDELNDRFGALSDDLDQVIGQLNVYNRFGELLFSGVDASATWDGKVNGTVAPDGLYTYTFSYKPKIGTEGNLGKLNGKVLLIK